MHLYLHVGTEKTGTTSLQQFMAANRRLLREKGIFYPQSPGMENHIALAAIARLSRTELWDQLRIADREQWEAFRRSFRQSLSAELAGHRAPTVVMSGEHCSSRLRTDEEVHRLLEFLQGFFDRITVVVYLRRQDDFLTSTYSTDVKNGGTQRLAVPDRETIALRYDYWVLLSRWARVFGRENMSVRRYGKSFLTDGNLVDDFLAVIGLDSRDGLQRPSAMNESLDAECLEFLRVLNQRLAPSDQRRGIVAALQAISDGPLIDLPPPELERFMSGVAESNRQVATEYFNGDASTVGDPLFGERREGRSRTPAPQLSVERAVEIAANLYMRLRSGGAKLHRPRYAQPLQS